MVQAWITAFLAIVSGITSGIATAVVNLFQTLFITTSGDTVEITVVGLLGIVALGTGLIIGLVKRVTGKLSRN